MGVYFPDLQMPRNCFQCPAREWYDYGGKVHGYACRVLHDGKIVTNVQARMQRRPDCPAKDYPEIEAATNIT